MGSGTDSSKCCPASLSPLLQRKILSSIHRLTLVLGVSLNACSVAAGQQATPTPAFKVTSNLVYLDVTVLDKKGHPVVTGLTKDDFSITDDKQPQSIFSFDPPAPIISPASEPGGEEPQTAPATIVVLDRLNSQFADFSFLRQSLRKYLVAQPAQLPAPIELMLLDNASLELIRGIRKIPRTWSTRSTAYREPSPTSSVGTGKMKGWRNRSRLCNRLPCRIKPSRGEKTWYGLATAAPATNRARETPTTKGKPDSLSTTQQICWSTRE
jgi:hypothetical protein